MNRLRDRVMQHAEKVRQHEDMEAALAGVFTQEAQAARDRFTTLAQLVIKPAFDEFRIILRNLERDAVIVCNFTDGPVLSIGISVLDRYLKLGVGKTLNLVNPKDDIAKGAKAKFYEVQAVGDIINIRQKVESDAAPLVTQVPFEALDATFLENELAGFFERCYPTQM
jgi:hypothetical protein